MNSERQREEEMTGSPLTISPSPRPSPPRRGRGSSSGGAEDRRRFSLSPAEGERAGVRGKWWQCSLLSSSLRRQKSARVLALLSLREPSAARPVEITQVLPR